MRAPHTTPRGRITPTLYRRLGLLICCAALASLAALPRAQGQPSAARFGEVVDVQLINVEVWVTDADGRPVRNLEAGDFTVREDGKKVEITHFSEVVDGRQSVAGAAAPAAAPPATAVEAGREAESHLILYFDEQHLSSHNRSRVVEDLRDFLASGAVPPERVLIMRQTRDLWTEAAFGADLNTLDKALIRLAESQPLGVETEQSKRLAIEEMQQLWEQAQLLAASGPQLPGTQGAPCDWFLPRVVPLIQSFSRTSQDRIRTTLDHLTAVASFLAALPGPKTLLYVADSLETTPGTDLMAFVTGVCPGGHSEMGAFMPADGLFNPFIRLTRHANTNRVTMYTLQAHGLKTTRVRSAEARSFDPGSGDPLAFAIRQRERDGFVLLAKQTGGRAIFNRNRFGPELATIGSELNSYYSLAYEPRHKGDGKEHKIKVRVAGKGLQVRHRRGYRDKDPNEQLDERLESAIHLGMMSNPLAARLGAGALESAGKNLYRLSLHVLVPKDRVTFLPQDEGDIARLTVRVMGRDAANRRVANDVRGFTVARPPEEADTLDLLVPLELRGGPMVLAVGLRDEATRETSYLSTSLEIQDPG